MCPAILQAPVLRSSGSRHTFRGVCVKGVKQIIWLVRVLTMVTDGLTVPMGVTPLCKWKESGTPPQKKSTKYSLWQFADLSKTAHAKVTFHLGLHRFETAIRLIMYYTRLCATLGTQW